jgi:hypothetical protein
MGRGTVFGNDIRDWGIKQQLLLGDEKTLKQAFRQTLELEFMKLAVGSSIRLWHRVTGHCRVTGPLPNRRRNGDMPIGYWRRNVT